MSKSPAFQFYAGDFLVGTMGMADDEVGIYIKMLAFQWERGSLPNCPKTIRKMINSKRIPNENVLEKFQVCDDGTLKNGRLEAEREKQQSFRESRIANANKRWEKECTSNARASRSTCKNDALQSSSSSSSSELPPNPQGGFDLEIEKAEKPDTERIAVGKLLGRRESTKWSAEELKLLKAIKPIHPDDLDLMQEFYSAEIPKAEDYRRTTIERLLKHWNGELDKARIHKSNTRHE